MISARKRWRQENLGDLMVAPLQNEITNSHKLPNLSELKFALAWAKLEVKLLSQRKKKQ